MAEGNGPLVALPDGARLALEQARSDRDRQITGGLRRWFKGFASCAKFYEWTLHCTLCRESVPNTAEAWRHWGECSGKRPLIDTSAGRVVQKTDTGLLWVTGRAVPRVELPATHMEWLVQFPEVGAYLLLGLHCARCEADLAGFNAESDAVFSCACGCREFIGDNRDHVELLVH